MCLAIPGKIVSIGDETAFIRMGRVQFGSIVKEASLAFVPQAKVGDYILVHAGVAISLVHEDEAQKIFSYLEKIDEIS